MRHIALGQLLHGIPQGSILVPLVFNLYLSDLFLEIVETNIRDFAADITPRASGYESNKVLINVEYDSNSILEWCKHDFEWK